MIAKPLKIEIYLIASKWKIDVARHAKTPDGRIQYGRPAFSIFEICKLILFDIPIIISKTHNAYRSHLAIQPQIRVPRQHPMPRTTNYSSAFSIYRNLH